MSKGIITKPLNLTDKLIDKKLSVIIPLHNEAEVIGFCHERVMSVLSKLTINSEIIYVDDGSSDGSWESVLDFKKGFEKLNQDSDNKNSSDDLESLTLEVSAKIKIIGLRFSRNFGKEAAMTAGLNYSTGDAVILLDADLQDPPELIPQMLESWQAGYDVVEMQRKHRDGETWVKKLTAKIFYKIINQLSDIEITENVGDFRLLDKRVVEQINLLPEKTRFMKGIFAWPGFKRIIIQFNRDARHSGQTKWNYFKLYRLAFEGVTSFSSKPLHIATILGLISSILAFVLAIFYALKKVIIGDPVTGFPTLITVVLLLGGIQLISIGLLGEYIGRLFIEAKQRPLYIVMEDYDSDNDA